MALIDIKDMNELKTAAEVRTVAQTALVDQQTGAVAYQINQAANTGEYRCFVSGPLLPEVLQALETAGYGATPAGIAKEDDRYVIDWYK